ncbi:MAG: glutamyl-tRNA reductase [Deltaproteobacteria bacterium]|nr:glutamyl-tRNA reductase [Deltaproteobacteria bacterium]
MRHIILIGLNHNTAPVELREKIAFSDPELKQALLSLKKKQDINEAFILSTCNRVEILAAVSDIQNAIQSIDDFFSEEKNIDFNDIKKFFYIYSDEKAAKHIFMVSAGLDSMILGEPQILGQLKEAYRSAVEQKTSGPILNRLIHKAFFTAKKIRTETGIGSHAVSISYAAVELAKKIFGELKKKTLLLIGAGEMAELAVEHLRGNKLTDIYVANRTFKNGVELAKKFGGRALKLQEVSSALEIVDIVIASTAASQFIISEKEVRNVIRSRRNRPIFFIDIAVPRNIAPGINGIANSYLYDIDDLRGVIKENKNLRNKEAVKAERIVEEAVITYLNWYESLDINQVISSLKSKLDGIGEAELKKTLSSLKHLSEQDIKALSVMTASFINKVLYDPILFLKSAGCKKDKTAYLDFTKKIFHLDNK